MLLKNHLIRLQVMLVSLLPMVSLTGQAPLNFGQSYQYQSEVLGEERTLNVLLPAEYVDSTDKKYPVLYLLDGAVSEDFFHVAGLIRYQIDHGMMPPAILVGIANVDRQRDFTYPSSDPRDTAYMPRLGGSALFIKFLTEELPIFIDAKFRPNGHRTLIGQSLGGLLATEVLLKHPGHGFADFVIVSPSLWYDNEYLYQTMDRLVEEMPAYPNRVFFSAGTEYPVMVDGPKRLARLLGQRTKSSWLHLPQEDHNTILHQALVDAFDEWYDPTQLHPYWFANKPEGLPIFSAPSTDSTQLAVLAYGDPLGLTNSLPSRPDTVAGYPGSWVTIGSDLGRGWVFDAFVSPVPVFKSNKSLNSYFNEHLSWTDSITFSTVAEDYSGEALDYTLYATQAGHKLILSDSWPTLEELVLHNVTWSQGRVLLNNWVSANGFIPCDASQVPPEFRNDRANYFKSVQGQNFAKSFMHLGELRLFRWSEL
ncbi:alpha/beta hydrolase-fold protein [Lewinella sp. 4G2]|uniref:alpha/beta hydrolase-fold protein n=1 Tax=Lewinella sp. 4G2 TaxID=1803372 RepID=UPI0007B49CB1|nr:alpha/beta hydrolase-fold protein [Lewinella sp. 4G2]OAV46032.1 hypothetical protein A3850_017330 [Lewinella sp. 4G2]